jgi:hypothetical protein
VGNRVRDDGGEIPRCGFPLDLWATDSGVPYDRLTFSDTTVCRSTGEEWNCEKV